MGNRRLAVRLWRVVGLGGVGAVFGGAATGYGVQIEPAAFLRHLRRAEDRRNVIVSFVWHAVFWTLAEMLDKKERRR